MQNIVNVAVQVLPSSTSIHPYAIVDKAIELIKDSGIRYQVCPFETVLEGPYDEVMDLVKKVQEKCFESGAQNLMTYIKIQSSAQIDVSIDDKMEKYR